MELTPRFLGRDLAGLDAFAFFLGDEMSCEHDPASARPFAHASGMFPGLVERQPAIAGKTVTVDRVP